jgi:hypothetical protein
MLTAHALRGEVELIAGRKDRALDFPAHAFGHRRVVVQDAGHRADGDACGLGNIFDFNGAAQAVRLLPVMRLKDRSMNRFTPHLEERNDQRRVLSRQYRPSCGNAAQI